jgi:trehalose synthase
MPGTDRSEQVPTSGSSRAKRLHNFLHGHPGDSGELGDADRQAYARTMAANARELVARIRRGDAVILHDPQTPGSSPT